MMDEPEPFDSPADDDAPAPTREPLTPQARRQLWLETAAVLALWEVPAIFGACSSLIWPEDHASPFIYAMLRRCVHAVSVSAPVLYLMWRSAEPWSTFGLGRPKWIVDPLLALALWGVGIVAHRWLWTMLGAILSDGVYEAVSARVFYPNPELERHGGAYLLLVVGKMASGFVQELVMRGYLIPRFERLLDSTVASVLLTTALFAGYHAYQGPSGVAASAMSGLVYGGTFCLVRRVWPLALAHAATLMVLTMSRG